jgi:hypothetical protein
VYRQLTIALGIAGLRALRILWSSVGWAMPLGKYIM